MELGASLAFDPDEYLKTKSQPQQNVGGFDPDAYLKERRGTSLEPVDDRSFGQVMHDALDVRNMPKNFVAGLQKIDEYTGAPVRKFITEKLTGEDLEKAPTGVEQAERMGFSNKSYDESLGLNSKEGTGIPVIGSLSPAGVMGLGLEVVQDPFLIAGAAKRGAQALLRGGASATEGMLSRLGVSASQEQAAKASSSSASRAGSAVEIGESVAEQGGKLFEVKAPQSLDELRNWRPGPEQGNLIGKKRLHEIEDVVPDLNIKPLKYHYSMLENPKAMKELKLKFENLPTEDAKKIAAYNQEIVDESSRKINQVALDLTGGQSRSISDSGYDVMATSRNLYNAEKEALGPVFQRIQQASQPLDNNGSRDLIQAIGENTKIGKLLDLHQDTGRFYLKKNTPRSGISDSEHGLIARVIDDMNDGMTFKEIQDTREFLRKAVDPTNPGATAEVNKVRSFLLGQLENMAGQYGDDVAQTFRGYAKNERARENVEKIIGGKIDSLDQMFSANPDKVVQKIFSSPNYTQVMKEYLGPEKIQELVGSYIQSGIAKATDSAKGFSPQTFKKWLDKNEAIISQNTSAGTFERLSALSDYGYFGKRFLDEVNPSGTAASLISAIEPQTFFQRVRQGGVKSAITSEVASRADSALKQRQSVKTVNEMLGSPTPPRDGVVSRVSKNISNIEAPISLKQARIANQTGSTTRGLGAQGMSVASNEDKPQKGPEKWVNTGASKLNQAGISQDIIESLRQSKQGRDLLIEASDASPGSKRMESVLKRIRTANQGGQ